MSTFNFDFNFIKSGAPIVTISGFGLAFNKISRNLLGFPRKINIGFDENAHAIGVRAHNDDPKIDSYEFESRVKDGWVRIGCKDFTKYLSSITNIDFSSKARQFISEYDAESQTLIVIVDEEHLKK